MNSKHIQMIAHSLVLVAIMLGLIAAALWFRPDAGSAGNRAQAQTFGSVSTATEDRGIPDAAKQRQMTVEQLEAINKRLADLERGFRDGSFLVQMIENKAAAGPSGRAGAKESQP
jgi:Flp pilus assembly protein CpaB